MKNENEKILWWKEPPEVLKTKFGRAKIGNTGYYQITSKKERNHGKLLHRLIFEDFWRSTIPEGFHIHHRNSNKTDNRR